MEKGFSHCRNCEKYWHHYLSVHADFARPFSPLFSDVRQDFAIGNTKKGDSVMVGCYPTDKKYQISTLCWHVSDKRRRKQIVSIVAKSLAFIQICWIKSFQKFTFLSSWVGCTLSSGPSAFFFRFIRNQYFQYSERARENKIEAHAMMIRVRKWTTFVFMELYTHRVEVGDDQRSMRRKEKYSNKKLGEKVYTQKNWNFML